MVEDRAAVAAPNSAPEPEASPSVAPAKDVNPTQASGQPRWIKGGGNFKAAAGPLAGQGKMLGHGRAGRGGFAGQGKAATLTTGEQNLPVPAGSRMFMKGAGKGQMQWRGGGNRQLGQGQQAGGKFGGQVFAKPAGTMVARRADQFPASPTPEEAPISLPTPAVEQETDIQAVIRAARNSRITLTIGSLLLMVVLPTVLAAIYYFLIASDQFVAESRFAVRGSEQVTSSDILGFLSSGASSGSPTADSYIMQQFIESRELIDKIEPTTHVRERYARADADWYARFDPEGTIEDFVKYWNTMVSADFDHNTGIMTLTVKAFTRQDAVDIANAIVDQSRLLVNKLSEQTREDTVVFAQNQVKDSEDRLAKARKALDEFRTTQSTVDPAATAQAHEQMMAGLDTQLMQTQSELAQIQKFVGPESPSRQILETKIATIKAQMEDRKKRVGAADPSDPLATENGLSSQLSSYQSLTTEEDFAQKAYVSALASLEGARAQAARDQRYLATFVDPAPAEDAEYPQRGLGTLVVFVAMLLIWGITSLFYAAIKDHVV